MQGTKEGYRLDAWKGVPPKFRTGRALRWPQHELSWCVRAKTWEIRREGTLPMWTSIIKYTVMYLIIVLYKKLEFIFLLIKYSFIYTRSESRCMHLHHIYKTRMLRIAIYNNIHVYIHKIVTIFTEIYRNKVILSNYRSIVNYLLRVSL